MPLPALLPQRRLHAGIHSRDCPLHRNPVQRVWAGCRCGHRLRRRGSAAAPPRVSRPHTVSWIGTKAYRLAAAEAEQPGHTPSQPAAAAVAAYEQHHCRPTALPQHQQQSCLPLFSIQRCWLRGRQGKYGAADDGAARQGQAASGVVNGHVVAREGTLAVMRRLRERVAELLFQLASRALGVGAA